jgi:CDP-2,3-bis-(O-geranylgeranyl)-sn-glycerol synthase
MLLASNGAPIVAARLFGARASTPVDFSRRLGDGNAIFGDSKTWRGLCAALLTACILALLFGLGLTFGLAFGCQVMLGDLFSSFIKRRRGLAPSDQSMGLDQLPESLLPALYSCSVMELAWWWALVLGLVFMLLQLLISRLLFLLHIRERPY